MDARRRQLQTNGVTSMFALRPLLKMFNMTGPCPTQARLKTFLFEPCAPRRTQEAPHSTWSTKEA